MADREHWREIEEEFNLFPEDDEINDQSQKEEYSYEKENQDWNRIMEIPDIITTKSGEKTRQQKQEIRDRHTINERKARIIKEIREFIADLHQNRPPPIFSANCWMINSNMITGWLTSKSVIT